MKLCITALASIVCSASVLSTAHAVPIPVDLSSWVQDGNGNWTLAADNNSVFQSLNSAPTVFQNNNATSQGNALNGSITVETSSDDDFIGFVLGYTQGDIDGNPDTDFILIDWKQGTQGGWDAGLSISRVTGPIQASGTNTNADAWDHVGTVELLSRANTLGDIGWLDNTTYDFSIEFTTNRIRVFVNNILEIDEVGFFADGAFGFYNFSQPSVRYAGITEEVLPPNEVPLPAALPLMVAGLAGLGFVSRRRKTR